MTTNYTCTFITVAPDSTTSGGTVPPTARTPTAASLQYALLSARPYELTSDDVLFEVHAARAGTPEEDRESEREKFFAKDQACLRASPLAKRYGWGFHHDEHARVALVAVGTPLYDELVERPDITKKSAMRSTKSR
ncbi:hypothetical protein EDF36_3812 [Rathayibacter sp. PhB152]|uniref:DUF6157 family protein n=1 Tax=Rathayibacter sp. PhB152 TaxID=2485190 RepID=UPI000F975369|nr:DUF6157 family protein [Rathayibacter sp. PhB152]ROQ52650.1 hypothetical protein EDF36_3812 [Rathayibacter sp. PhB152]